MGLRKPNFFLFLIALVLAVVGVMQYLGIPIKIPEIPGVAIPKVAIPDNIPVISQISHTPFWILFSGWVVLAFTSLFPRRRLG
jgi:hypothetical protein